MSRIHISSILLLAIIFDDLATSCGVHDELLSFVGNWKPPGSPPPEDRQGRRQRPTVPLSIFQRRAQVFDVYSLTTRACCTTVSFRPKEAGLKGPEIWSQGLAAEGLVPTSLALPAASIHSNLKFNNDCNIEL